jgi:hypothetical protein
MQFPTLASHLAATALAAPAPQNEGTYTETISITDFSLRKSNATIQSVSFKLAGDATTTPLLCSYGPTPTFPSETVTCGSPDSNYRVILIAPKDAARSDVDLAIYHQTGQASGLWAEASAPPAYCHAGGLGGDDFICTQIPEVYNVFIGQSG